MKECPSCALDVNGSPNACPYCGYEFPGQTKGFTRLMGYLLIAIMLWPIYELVMFLLNR